MAFIDSYKTTGCNYQLLSPEGEELRFSCADKIEAREMLS